MAVVRAQPPRAEHGKLLHQALGFLGREAEALHMGTVAALIHQAREALDRELGAAGAAGKDSSWR
jgi:hypothetical protein